MVMDIRLSNEKGKGRGQAGVRHKEGLNALRHLNARRHDRQMETGHSNVYLNQEPPYITVTFKQLPLVIE